MSGKKAKSNKTLSKPKKAKKAQNEIVINTPYDDAFRTMVNDCEKLLIPVINLVFGKHYDMNEKIVFHHNEHFIRYKNGTTEKRVTDSYFTIAGDVYLLECQSTADNTMIIRIIEYAFLTAIENASFSSTDTMEMTFPRTAVLFLRSDTNTPEKMKYIIHFPEGDFATYSSVIKIKDYSINDIFDNKLYFLIPFLVFNYEKDFKKYNTDSEKLKEFMQDYEEILYRLEQAKEAGDLLQINIVSIRAMLKKVIDNLAANYVNIKEGVNSIMGGKVLNYPGKSIYLEGEQVGYKRGHTDGIDEDRRRLAEDMLNKEKYPFSEIVELSKLSPEVVQGIAQELQKPLVLA